MLDVVMKTFIDQSIQCWDALPIVTVALVLSASRRSMATSFSSVGDCKCETLYVLFPPGMCFVVGVLWWRFTVRTIHRLQSLDKSEWAVSDLNKSRSAAKLT